MRRRTLASHVLFGLLLTGLLFLGYHLGTLSVSVHSLRITEAGSILTGFSVFVLASGGLFVRRVRRDDAVEPADDPVTAIVPTYRDPHVLHHSVESLRRADHSVDVLVVCEPDDEAGVERARELAAHEDVSYLVNPNPGSKASAINAAVDAAETDVFGVFDADQEISPGFVTAAVGHLQTFDVVQSRFVTRPTGVVESLAYYEHTLFNFCFRQPLHLLTDFRMAASKAVVFSREAFEAVGGYDSDVVTEDTDFAHQCYRADLDVKLLYGTPVSEEAVHSLRDWWGQRKRWVLGDVEVVVRLLGEVRRNPRNPQSYTSLAIGAAPLVASALLLTLAANVASLVATGNFVLAFLPVVSIYAVAIVGHRVDGLGRSPTRLTWVLTPLVIPAFGLVTLRALVDYALTWDGEWFSVEKSE